MDRHSIRADTAFAIALIAFFGVSASSIAGQESMDGPRLSKRTVTVDVGASDPAVSPDGRRLAVSILGSIFLMPVEGGAAVRVTDGVGWDTGPAWSPDGRFLAYAHNLPQGAYLALRNLKDGTTRFLHRAESRIGAIAFHPEGEQLFFVLDNNQYDAHVQGISLEHGAEPESLTSTQNWHEWSFALSPSGDTLFLESGRYGGADLYFLRLPALEAERLTRTPEINEFGVAWAPDGRRVWIAQENGVDRVLVQDPGDAEPREIHESPYSGKTLTLTPDGTAIILASARRLLRVDLDTGSTRAIPFTANFELSDPFPGDLVIANARVFTGTGDEYVEDATVVVRDGRIASVTSGREVETAGAADPLPDAAVLDARGRVLMAGLMDNHFHYWTPFAGGRLLSRGITTVRDPGVEVSSSMDYQDALELGIIPGPGLFSAGPLIDGPGGYHPAVDVSLDRPEAAAALVRALHEQGVDFLKVYFLLEPEVLSAVIDAAHELGLPVTGHIGVRTSWGEALQAGIDGLNHIRVWRDFLPPEIQPTGENESLDGRKWPIARMQADWRRIDPKGAEVGALIERMVGRGVAMDPTLAIQRIGEQRREQFSLEQFEIASRGYERMQAFIRRAHDSGVPILAGTDNLDLVTELEAYAEAGLPNAAILRAATINGARWLGKEHDFGTVEAGKRADLILVDGDPLEDLGDLRSVDVVIQAGRITVQRSGVGLEPRAGGSTSRIP